ncbi:uncharacterized protein LOC120210851 [Hibiscus syriacus]|uniref:uncharacterized protein LOC120210851 n=1 Tax=Hibiscus syriacus TaxID=106335 RepID=UPI0019221955|nr:uncharacterized protein LOC120210851 [Hibiscus syriacus]
MATVSGASPHRDSQSGAVSPDTPYDRPGFLNSALQNHNWISRNIFPPTRSIVTGAGRVLASVLGFESSSSSSSSECGSCSDDTHDNNDDQEVSSQGVHAIEYRVPQSFAGKTESKCLIEQLLMEESFSRQECDKLTDIIKSRVVDSPSICGLGLGRLGETPERTAVLEATKLLEEKKSGSNDKSEGHHGTAALNSVMLKHDVEREVGLPVDLAKSYKQTCPPWASPSKNNTEFRSPSSVVMSLFKEDTPYSIGSNFLYSSKRKRNSLATGSWNIQDEIRKVRFKATEEMLRNLSSSKIDWPSIPLEHKKGPDSIAANNLGPAREDKVQISKRPVDVSIDLAAKSVPQLTKDLFHIDALQDQVMQPTQSIKEEKDETLEVGPILQSTVYVKTETHSDVDAPEAYHLKESNGSIQPFSCTREGTAQDSQVEEKNCWKLNEVAGIRSPTRFPSGSNMSSEVDKEKNHGPIISEENKAGACRDENRYRVVAEEKRELLCEAPTVNETDAADSGSHRSWSMQNEGSPQDQNTPTSKASSTGKRDFTIEQQQQREKVSRYNMRNRGPHR